MHSILPLVFSLVCLFPLSLSFTCSFQPLSLSPLPYDYSALSPIISEKIMFLHHTKHHQAYINNYNSAIKSLEEALNLGDLNTIENLQNFIKFNLGGHLNHEMFWKMLAPIGKGGFLKEDSELLKKINEAWGNLENMKMAFNKKATAIQVFFLSNFLLSYFLFFFNFLF